jgi:hypothetical protein
MLRNPYEETSLRKGEREKVRPYIWVAYGAILALVIIALAGCASVPAKVVVHSYSGPHGVATFYDGACTEEKVLKHIPEQYRHLFKAGEGTYDGPRYELCWSDAVAPGTVLMVWEDGGIGQLGKEVLRGGTGA